MPGRGRPRALQYDWLITYLFLSTSIYSLYQANRLGAYVVDLGVAALGVGLIYAFFRKYLSFFEGLTPFVYLGLGFGIFWAGAYGGLGSSFSNIFQPISGSSANLVPLAFINGGAEIDVFSIGVLLLVGLWIFLSLYELGYLNYEGMERL